jgi:hypothetical protein
MGSIPPTLEVQCLRRVVKIADSHSRKFLKQTQTSHGGTRRRNHVLFNLKRCLAGNDEAKLCSLRVGGMCGSGLVVFERVTAPVGWRGARALSFSGRFNLVACNPERASLCTGPLRAATPNPPKFWTSKNPETAPNVMERKMDSRGLSIETAAACALASSSTIFFHPAAVRNVIQTASLRGCSGATLRWRYLPVVGERMPPGPALRCAP